jgi:hypothetical protein
MDTPPNDHEDALEEDLAPDTGAWFRSHEQASQGLSLRDAGQAR